MGQNLGGGPSATQYDGGLPVFQLSKDDHRVGKYIWDVFGWFHLRLGRDELLFARRHSCVDIMPSFLKSLKTYELEWLHLCWS